MIFESFFTISGNIFSLNPKSTQLRLCTAADKRAPGADRPHPSVSQAGAVADRRPTHQPSSALSSPVFMAGRRRWRTAVNQCRPWWRPRKSARAPRGEGDAGAQDRRGIKGGGSSGHERRPTAAMASSGGETRPNWLSPEHEPRRWFASGKAEGEVKPGVWRIEGR
jgi:hypothetical protein